MTAAALAYFTSPKAAAEFALLHTDGQTRQELLGATSSHYKHAAEAEAWYVALKDLGISDEAREEALGFSLCHASHQMKEKQNRSTRRKTAISNR